MSKDGIGPLLGLDGADLHRQAIGKLDELANSPRPAALLADGRPSSTATLVPRAGCQSRAARGGLWRSSRPCRQSAAGPAHEHAVPADRDLTGDLHADRHPDSVSTIDDDRAERNRIVMVQVWSPSSEASARRSARSGATRRGGIGQATRAAARSCVGQPPWSSRARLGAVGPPMLPCCAARADGEPARPDGLG